MPSLRFSASVFSNTHLGRRGFYLLPSLSFNSLQLASLSRNYLPYASCATLTNGLLILFLCKGPSYQVSICEKNIVAIFQRQKTQGPRRCETTSQSCKSCQGGKAEDQTESDAIKSGGGVIDTNGRCDVEEVETRPEEKASAHSRRL